MKLGLFVAVGGPSMPSEGEIVGKYRLVGLIGTGGMGEVYEALHEEIGKRVAVKFLHSDVAHDPEAVARFKREAQAAAAIGHKSIIDVYDIGTVDDGSLFLVMEFLEGRSLGDLLEDRERLSVSSAVYVVAQVLSALDVAHRKGIVHRDLKPDNIFLVPSGQPWPDVKLLDFGISKIVNPSRPEERLTQTGMVMGTPYYMAPEQARGLKDHNHQVDLYAMGVILYECLTGTVPFEAENALALFQALLHDPVVPPKELREDLPSELNDIVLRAMARDPDDRYPNVGDLGKALIPFLDPQAPRVSFQDSIGRPSDSLVLMGEPSASTGGEGSALTFPASTSLAWEGPTDRTHSKGRGWSLLAAGLAGLLLVLAAGGVGTFMWWRGSSGSSASARPQPAAAPPEEAVTPAPLDTAPSVQLGDLIPVKTAGAVAPDASAAPMAAEDPDDLVTITLEGIPSGAMVYLDGEPAAGSPLRLKRSTTRHAIRVELDGRELWSDEVTGERDRVLAVELPRPGRSHRRSSSRRPEKQAEEPRSATETPTKARDPSEFDPVFR